MDIQRRALYNALRLNWLQDPTLTVEEWQVEDYREMPYSLLFEQLRLRGVSLDRLSFMELTKECDSPEEVAEKLFEEGNTEEVHRDCVYLIIFELWRRLLPDKPCLSIFCDELDQQISLYDQGEVDNLEALHDALANLQVILEENSDGGMKPTAVFAHISSCCAHNIEDFLIDYISEQLDEENLDYASDLLEGFSAYLPDPNWVALLRARLLMHSDCKAAILMIRRLLEHTNRDFDLDLELLSFLVFDGDKRLLMVALNKCLKQISNEEDLHDLLDLCIDYQRSCEEDQKAEALQRLLYARRPQQSGGKIPSRSEVIAQIKVIMS